MIIIEKVIAVDIDDVLNNFTATLTNTKFVYSDSYGLSYDEFTMYLGVIKQADSIATEFLTSKFSDFRSRIHTQCYSIAQANPEGIAFMQWLRLQGWKTVICTKRNLRLAGESTKQWLVDQQIPYDYLVMALNKVVFCKLWQIPYLVDDDVLNITYGEQYGIKVFYPFMTKHNALPITQAQRFTKFEEIKQWIPE